MRQIFETDRRNVKRRVECYSEEVLHVCEEERWHTVSLQKFIIEIHPRLAIDHFLCSLSLNKPFSVISDPVFTEANNALEHLEKTSEKNGQHCWRTIYIARAHKKTVRNQFTMKR